MQIENEHIENRASNCTTVILNMDYCVNMDGMKREVVYVKVHIIGRHKKINAVR